MMTKRGGLLARLRAALTVTRQQLTIEDELRERIPGTTAIADIVPRERVELGGTLSSVTYPPVSQTPLLRARLFDGTGSVELVFLGRRSVPGIEPGQRLRATGTPISEGRGFVLYSPAIDLVSSGEEDSEGE